MTSTRGPLLLLSVSVFAAICTEMLPVGLLPEVGRGLGVATATAGLLVSAYAVLVAITALPIAALAERWPRRTALRLLLGAYAVSNLAFAVAPNFPVALVARAVGGLAHAGFFSVAVAAAVSLVEPARSGRAVAGVMLGNALALVFGVPLGTVLGSVLGWRWSFVILAAVMVLLATAVVRVLPEDSPAHVQARTPVLVAVRRPALILMAAVIILLALGHFTLYTYVSDLLLHDGIAQGHIGIVLFGYGVGGLIGLSAASALVGRWAGLALIADGLLMTSCLALGAVVGSAPAIIAVVVLWGIAFGAFPTLTQTVTLRAAREATDAATALVNGTTNVGIAGGALLGSRLIGSVQVTGLGWIGAGFAAASVLLFGLRLCGLGRDRT